MLRVIGLLALFGLVIAPGIAIAEEDATLFPVPDYSGDWKSRPRASGDWGGVRQDLADKGVQVELDFVQTVQGIVDGGINKDTDYRGSLDLVLKLDVQKLGLWPGAFVMVRAETLFGETVAGGTGSLMATSTDSIVPSPASDTYLTDLHIIQFLHPKVGIVLGRISTLDGDQNEFAHGRGTSQFQNLAFVANPVPLRTVPYTALGAGLIFVPTDNIQVQFSVLDAEGSANDAGFDTLFKDGTTLALEGRIATSFFGLPGHQLAGGSWSDRKYVSLDQDPRILLNLIPGFAGAIPLNRVDDSWSVYYNFDQYIWQPDGESDKGLGLFGRFGYADEDASPIEWFVSIGLGAKGIVPGRPDDSFGVGYFTVGPSDNFPAFIDISHSEGFEIYYDIAVTPWWHFTPDLQVIESAIDRIDTAVILGFRTKMEF